MTHRTFCLDTVLSGLAPILLLIAVILALTSYMADDSGAAPAESVRRGGLPGPDMRYHRDPRE